MDRPEKTDLSTAQLKQLMYLSRRGVLSRIVDAELMALAFEALLREREAEPKSAHLFCAHCGELHVDKFEEDGTDWSKRSHRTHRCHFCEKTWTPFDFPTFGAPLPAKLTEAINNLSQSALAAVRERDSLRDRVLELEGASILDKNAMRLQRERAEEVEAQLAAQKELNATTSAQLAEAVMERPTILNAEAIAEMVGSEVSVKLHSLDRITVDGLLTLVKLAGCGGRISGVTKPEGWPFVICAVVGSPGNAAAVEVLQRFDDQLRALGAPIVASGGKLSEGYHE